MSKMAKAKDVAIKIKDVIGEANIVSYTNCMTRLRVKAKPNFDAQQLKQIDGVLGLVTSGSDEFQIVLGPGFVNKVAVEFSKIVDLERGAEINENLDDEHFKSASEVAKDVKAKVRGTGKVRNFLSKISKIFTPLIPAFIGAGLLSGIGGLMSSVGDSADASIQSWNKALTLMLTILSNVFIIGVCWRMGEEWGGSPAISALIGAIYASMVGGTIAGLFIANADGTYNFLGIHIANISKNWLSVGFVNLSTGGEKTLGAPHAGLIGAMIAAGVTIYVEKQFRKFMPGAVDTIITPVVVIFLMLLANLFVIIPLAGYLFTGISFLFEHLYSNAFGAMVLAGIFLFALVFGVHQGFLPIYYSLIESTGVNGLFPIMCMGGCAQVGVCIMLFILAEKKSLLRKQIAGAIIPGFLGIGEPLIYGVTLPRLRSFFIACISAAFGGFYLGAMNAWWHMGLGMNAPTGPGGLTATIMMTTVDGDVVKGVLVYLSGVFITYGLGALLCWFGYSRIAVNGSNKMKAVYQKNGAYSVGQKVGYSFMFATVIGIFIYWIADYAKLPKADKQALKLAKVE
jgi:N-acetylmuramic acid-specific PTS system IIC component